MKEQSSRDENGQFINNPKWDHSSIRNWLEELKLYETRSLTKFVPDCSSVVISTEILSPTCTYQNFYSF